MNSQTGKALSKAVPASVFSPQGFSHPLLCPPLPRGEWEVARFSVPRSPGIWPHLPRTCSHQSICCSGLGCGVCRDAPVRSRSLPIGNTRGQPCRADPLPHTCSRWTGDPSSPWRGCPGRVDHLVPQASQPEPPTDVLAEVPEGRGAGP